VVRRLLRRLREEMSSGAVLLQKGMDRRGAEWETAYVTVRRQSQVAVCSSGKVEACRRLCEAQGKGKGGCVRMAKKVGECWKRCAAHVCSGGGDAFSFGMSVEVALFAMRGRRRREEE